MTPTHRQKAGPHDLLAHKAVRMFHRVLPADPLAVRTALTDIRARFRDDVGAETLGRLELVLAEVMNNVTKHAGTKYVAAIPSIHLSIVRHETGLACAVTDDGVTLPPECLLPRKLPAADLEDLPEGGFGWYLIQGLTQSLCYYREDQRNFLAFNVPLAGDEPVEADYEAD